jgi:hypothetical protein
MIDSAKSGLFSSKQALIPKWPKWGVFGSVIAILILTVLEFPAPIGFETRPQNNVSHLWLVLFLAILVTEIVTLLLIFKRPQVGMKFGVTAGALNILQVYADQAHLMQPQVAPLGYSLLEGAVALVSLVLIYFAWKVHKSVQDRGLTP